MAMMGVVEYARHRGVSHPAVIKAIAQGRILKRKGKIDSESADRMWELNRKQAQQSRLPAPPSLPSPQTDRAEQVVLATGTMRLRREKAQAEIAEIQLAKLKGALIERDVARQTVSSMSMAFSDFVRALPDRLAGALAAVTDADTIHKILKSDGERHLYKLSQTLKSSELFDDSSH
jgi:hypothetical protein